MDSSSARFYWILLLFNHKSITIRLFYVKNTNCGYYKSADRVQLDPLLSPKFSFGSIFTMSVIVILFFGDCW